MSQIIYKAARKIHRVPPLPSHVDAAKYLTDLFASSGEWTTLLLQQGATYNLQSKIVMRQNNQELATEGYPIENEKKAKIYTRGDNETVAVDASNLENTVLKSLIFEGCRTELGLCKKSDSLIIIGGWQSKDLVIDSCVMRDPRGWSCCHVLDGSQGARVVNNEVGPAGQQAPEGPWADGLSIACRNGLIANNTIIDATDGAIVVFCAPGTTVIGNTIIARTRNMLGAINMVDPFPFERNYTGTRVLNNHIRTEEGAFIHIGIGIGPGAWSDNHKDINYGGLVMDNVFGPGRFGYAIGAGGCKDFTVLQNKISSNTVFSASMDLISEVSPPTPFLVSSDHNLASGTFQDDFVEGPVRFLIGVRDKLGKKLQYSASALKWETGNNRQTGGRSGVELEDVKFELSEEGRLLVWDQKIPGRVLWDSRSGTDRRREAIDAIFGLDSDTGRLTIKSSKSGIEETIWDPAPYLAEIQHKCQEKGPKLILADTKPYLQVIDASNILWSSTAEWTKMELYAGSFIAVAAEKANHDSPAPPVNSEARPSSLSEAFSSFHIPHHSHDQPPALPPRPTATGQVKNTWLYLDPETTQLILHSSSHPDQVDDGQVLWRSPNWKKCKSLPHQPSHANLQGDGNLVIYGTDAGAVWASCTNAAGKTAASIAIVALDVDGAGGRLELKDKDGKVIWNSKDA